MIILMQCVNEGNYVERVLSDFHDENFAEKIIIIDGGSTDLTIQKLNQFDKVNVFVHPWLPWYHDMNITQRNIGMSYVPHGEIFFYLDFDERMSDDLKAFLNDVNKNGMPQNADQVCVSRRSYECMRHEDSPFAMFEPDGWPVVAEQIGQYPDWQGRLIQRQPRHHFINSPHHKLGGEQNTVNVPDTDIIHYHGRDDSRERDRIEAGWARAQARRIELGLTADEFETRLNPEYAEYGDPETWHKQSN